MPLGLLALIVFEHVVDRVGYRYFAKNRLLGRELQRPCALGNGLVFRWPEPCLDTELDGEYPENESHECPFEAEPRLVSSHRFLGWLFRVRVFTLNPGLGPPGPNFNLRRTLFRGRIVDVAHDAVMIEMAGQEKKIEAFIEMMRPFGIIELVRTGRIAMVRGRNSM